MRFKAKLAPSHVSMLYSLMVPMSKLASATGGGGGTEPVVGSHGGGSNGNAMMMRNGSILYLDNHHLRISVKGRSHDTDGIACFAEVATEGGIFLEHRIESVTDNIIVMEIDLVQFRLALQSVASSSSGSNKNNGFHHQEHQSILTQNNLTVLKLAKRQNIPCLCLESCTADGMQVHHTIPVRILRSTEMQHHLPPAMCLPDVQLEMVATTTTSGQCNYSEKPQMPLRTAVEGLRSLSPTLFLTANMVRGEVTVQTDREGASVRTFFSSWIPRPEGCRQQQEELQKDINQEEKEQDATAAATRPPAAEECTVKVDSKKLAAALQWQLPQYTGLASSALLCLVENEMLVIHVVLHPSEVGFFTYYVPVHTIMMDE